MGQLLLENPSVVCGIGLAAQTLIVHLVMSGELVVLGTQGVTGIGWVVFKG